MEGRKELPPRLNACADSTLLIEITATAARADRTHRVAKWAEGFFKERVFMASPPSTLWQMQAATPVRAWWPLKTLGPRPVDYGAGIARLTRLAEDWNSFTTLSSSSL